LSQVLLNLGCGDRLHSAWTNLDFTSNSPAVQSHDLRRGIPLKDGVADAVYLSHLLEHFPRKEGQDLLKECYRVLRRGGVLRVVVPDLERTARLYLQALENALRGYQEWELRYDWMMLELYDQTVRETSGGGMLEYFQQKTVRERSFVLERLGGEARRLMRPVEACTSQQGRRHSSLTAGVFLRLRQLPSVARAKFLRLMLGGRDYRALEVGRFRLHGEVHQWMYDQFSLARALRSAGFEQSLAVGPTESQIPGWAEFYLDSEPDGAVYKPDSLYMEALKP